MTVLEPTPPIEWVAIVTSGRPVELDRCLMSLEPHLTHYRGPLKLVVGDDSPTERDRVRNRAALKRVSKATRSSAYWLDRDAKIRLAGRLSGLSGLPVEMVRFAFFGFSDGTPTFGGNQNAVHLFTKGGGVFVTDDDIIVRPTTFADRLIGDTGEAVEPEVTRFFETDLLLQEALREISANPFEVLSHALTGLTGQNEAILATFGLCGDPATMSSSHLVATNNQTTRRELRRSASYYATARSKRHLIRQAPTLRTIPMQGFVSAAYGLNNSVPTAPFVPILRGSDHGFGETLSRSFPRYQLCRLPLSLPHAPPHARDYSGDFAALYFHSLVSECLDEFSRRAFPSDEVDRPASLSLYLNDIGSLSEYEFSHWLQALLRRRLQTTAAFLLERLYLQGPEPRFLERDLRLQIEAIELRLADSDPLIPLDVLPEAEPFKRMKYCRDLLQRWAMLVACWPSLETAARTRLDREEFALDASWGRA